MTPSPDATFATRFRAVPSAPPDPILGLVEAFEADPRENKMNLSSGVYKDASGITPVLPSVKEAERRLLETERTKSYLPIDGLAGYREQVRRLVFGDRSDPASVAIAQTPGGTGALRVAAEFVRDHGGTSTVHLPNPTWANHASIFAAAGLATEAYPYLTADRRGLDFERMLDHLRTAVRPGDAVLLHACCHNPAGIDPTADQWRQIAAVLAERQLLPLVDFAYQGFAEGLEEDAAGLRAILSSVGEAIVCNSFSKNFGLYSERVGAVSVVTGDADATAAVRSQLKRLIRSNYSNPPRHGGTIVATILGDDALRARWREELDEMRGRIRGLRVAFVGEMKRQAPGHDFSFLLEQHGMFSFSGLNPMQVDELKAKHGIYIVGSGRINVAGMTEPGMGYLCRSIADVL